MIRGKRQLSAKTTGFALFMILAALCAAQGIASAASGAAFTITGSVISGPPGNSKPVSKSTVTLFQAGVLASFGLFIPP